MSNFSFKKRWGHLILLFVCTLSLFIYVNCAYAAIAPDANRTFTHPAEDNQTKNLTLTPDTYTFRTDADPNGGHYVQWYDTYSGTDNCLEEEYLYYYDDHDFSFSSSGNYWVRAEIYDSNWNWQAAYRWYVTIGEPDLIVEDIWLSPASPVEGEEYTVYARVKNVGNAAAGASETGFYIDGDKLYWHINTQALGINDSTDVAYNDLTAPSAGSHTFKAVADIDTAVAESNEINNDDYSESISVATPLKPDYIVTKMTIDDKDTNINISPSDMVRLDFWVKNVGDAKGDSSTLRWWYGTSEGDMSVYIGEGSIAGINGLAIGEEEKESDVIWFVPELDTGQYYLVAKADADEEVDEKIEENNVYSIPFSVFHRMEPSYSKGDFEYSPDLGEASDAETSVCGKIPVVLVHGNNGDKKPASLNYWYWWIEQYFNASANVGKFKVYRYIYDSYDHIGEDKDPPVLAENGDENATRFADFINGFDEFQGKKIIIMAHSMGGLVVRSALNNNAELREKTLKLITLGTPHLGSPAANPTWAMSLPSGADLLLTTIGPLFFDGTPGDFDLAWHDINEIPVDVTSIDIINALLNLIAYDWDLLNDSLVSPYTGEIGESYLSDDYILAFGGYLGLFWISSELYDSAPQEVKEELDGDHGGCWLLHDVLAGFEKRDGSNFLYTDGPVPLESAMFDSHPSVNSINITDSAVLDEHLDHSSYLDVARIMDYIMSKILLEAENSYPPNINPINDHATIEGEPYNGPMPSLSYHVLPVAWSLVEGPVGMDIDLCTGMVSWLNPTESGSPHTITIRATNAAGSDDETWFLTVSSSAEAPVIVPISYDSMVEGSPYTGPTPTLSAGTLPATWSLVNNPVGMTINSSTGLVTWPNPTVAGSPYAVTIRATNAAGSDDETWFLTVSSSAEAPVIVSISDDSMVEGSPYTGPTPTLSDGTLPVTWSLVNNPVGMTINSSTGLVSWPNPTVAGSPHTITIRATNASGSDDESWQLIVTSSGEAPIINPISDDSTIEGEPYTGTTPTLFSGTQPVTWSIADGPSGMTIDSSTGVVSWSSPIVNESPHTITIRATNTEGSDDESWQLIVKQNIVYTITATAGSHGSISPSGTFDVVEESDQQFTAVPDTNYVVDEWYLDGNEVQAGGTIYTLSNVQSDHTVYVMLKEYPTNGWRYTRADVAGSSYYPWGSTELTENTLQEKYSINNASGSVLTGDVTGDGHLELIYVSGDQLKIYDSTGKLLHTITLGSSSCSVSMLEDINCDGVLDIGIGTGGTSDLKTYFYDGEGNLLKTLSKSAGSDCSMRPAGLLGNGDFAVSFNAGYSHSDMYRGFAVYDKDSGFEKWHYKVGPAFGITSIADFDGDGMLDFANEAYTVHNGCNADGCNNNGTMTTDGDIWLIVVDEQGNEKFSKKYSTPSDGSSRHYFVDLDHDGIMEILGFEGHDPNYYHGTSEIHLFDQDGQITHTFAGSEDAGWSFTITDINGDGKGEVIASNYPGGQMLYVLDHNLAMQNSAGIAGRVQLSCDLNGDGDIEVVLLDDDGNLKVVDKNLQVLNTINVGSHGTVIAGDLDQDGIVELICMTIDRGIHVFGNTKEVVPELSIIPNSRTVNANIETTTFTVNNTGSGAMSWTASVISGQNWLSITSDSTSGTNSGTITAEFSANTSGSSRTGTIRVTASGAGGSPKDVTVMQSGFDTDNDGLPDDWENQHFGNLTTADSITDTDGDGLLDKDEYAYETDPNNTDSDGDGDSDGDEVLYGSDPNLITDTLDSHRPNTPVVLPISGNVPLRGQIFDADEFGDLDHGDYLSASEWQISTDQNFTQNNIILQKVFEKRSSAAVDAIEHRRLLISQAVLVKANTYWVRTRHKDSIGLWSTWSAPVSFATITDDPDDTDNNGIDDESQVAGFVDTNDNGTDDNQENIHAIHDAEEGDIVGIHAGSGVLGSLNAIPNNEIPSELMPADPMPNGLFSFRVDGLPVDANNPATVDITFYFPEPLPFNTKWYKYDLANNTMTDFTSNVTINGNHAVLSLTDGGPGDADGVVNGIIVDPSGPAVPPTSEPTPDPPSNSGGGGGGGGGCFIATAAFGSYMEPSVTILRQFRDVYLLPHRPSQLFVETYYRYSPPVADFIAKHNSLRAAVRLGLAPIIGMCWIVLNYGLLFASLIMMLFVTILFGSTVLILRRRKIEA